MRVDLTLLDAVISAHGYIQAENDVTSDETDANCLVRIENKFVESFPVNRARFVLDIFSPTVTPQNPVEFFVHEVKGFLLEPNDFVIFSFPLKPIPSKFSGGCEVTLSIIELYVGHDCCLSFDNRHYNLSKFSSNQVHQRESIRLY